VKFSPSIAVIAAFLSFFQAFPIPAAAYQRRTPVVEAVEKAGPSVVNIRTEKIVERRSSPFFGFSDPFFEEFFRDLSPPRTYTTQALGSGVIIDPRGFVLTNAHVIEKASRIFAALPGRDKELEAVLVGVDDQIDLAVLRIESGEKFPYLKPGSSEDIMVGETVVAIGNPLGLEHSITTGIVSTPRRHIPLGDGRFTIFIQTDALINPGNSGGPLLNINGDLIGVNTAIARRAQGIGFAIPIDTVKRVLGDLMEFGSVRRSYVGIVPVPVGEIFTKARGRGGVLVDHVEPDSPAQAAGFRFGDVILHMDDEVVSSPAEYSSILRTYTPDTKIRLGLLRGTEKMELSVSLTAVPEGYGLKYGKRLFGLVVVDGREGVTVDKVIKGSPADEAGIRDGDLVAELEGERLQTLADYARLIERHIGQEPVRFLIVRGSRGYYVDLP
jgi:serine protease Do